MLANYIAWVIFGALTGWIIAQLRSPESSSERLTSIVIGAAATFLSGLLLRAFAVDRMAGFNVAILIVSIVVSVIFLVALQGFSRHLHN